MPLDNNIFSAINDISKGTYFLDGKSNKGYLPTGMEEMIDRIFSPTIQRINKEEDHANAKDILATYRLLAEETYEAAIQHIFNDGKIGSYLFATVKKKDDVAVAVGLEQHGNFILPRAYPQRELRLYLSAINTQPQTLIGKTHKKLAPEHYKERRTNQILARWVKNILANDRVAIERKSDHALAYDFHENFSNDPNRTTDGKYRVQTIHSEQFGEQTARAKNEFMEDAITQLYQRIEQRRTG